MNRSLQEHVLYLEGKIESLKARLNEKGSPADEHYQTRIDLGIAERALVYFRKAFELERKISG